MKPRPRPIRYAVYTRQSVDGPDDFSSCDAQFAICRDFADASGEQELRWCQQRFDDPGHSGANLDRPGMRKLRKVVDLGGIDRIYAVALDRVTRNMRDAVVLLDEFEKAGVQLQFVHQPVHRHPDRRRQDARDGNDLPGFGQQVGRPRSDPRPREGAS